MDQRGSLRCCKVLRIFVQALQPAEAEQFLRNGETLRSTSSGDGRDPGLKGGAGHRTASGMLA